MIICKFQLFFRLIIILKKKVQKLIKTVTSTLYNIKLCILYLEETLSWSTLTNNNGTSE
jgi:hypothetical protein